ncbi:MAG: YbaK/EbsC family protein [Anaerolineales bacterium]|nr:YbaK/EbsC family protein [Anaerolineales bacterium]
MTTLPAHEYLDQLNIPYAKADFPPAIEKGAASVARALGYRERQMIKTLIFELDTSERILVMVGGDQNIVSGNLKKAAGSRNIKMAGYEAVKEATGYVIGSIPPFSWQLEGFRTFLDVSLMNEPVLGVGTGVWGHEILISPENLVKASWAILVNLVDREKTAFLDTDNAD